MRLSMSWLNNTLRQEWPQLYTTTITTTPTFYYYYYYRLLLSSGCY